MSDSSSTFKFYHYDPSLAAAIIFIIGFKMNLLIHAFQMFQHRTWFVIPLVIGAAFEVTGYICRAVSSRQTPNWTLTPYLIQSLTLLVAPALFAATIYMTLGRIILFTGGEKHSVISRRWLTKIFVTGDVLSFLAQSAGGGLLAQKSTSSENMGKNIIIGGLLLQILFFAVFIVVGIVFNVRMNKDVKLCSDINPVWQSHLKVLYAASTLIMVRSIFRVAEFAQGYDGYIMSHEVFLYLFDGVLMLGVLVLLNVKHPHGLKVKEFAKSEMALKQSSNVQV